MWSHTGITYGDHIFHEGGANSENHTFTRHNKESQLTCGWRGWLKGKCRSVGNCRFAVTPHCGEQCVCMRRESLRGREGGREGEGHLPIGWGKPSSIFVYGSSSSSSSAFSGLSYITDSGSLHKHTQVNNVLQNAHTVLNMHQQLATFWPAHLLLVKLKQCLQLCTKKGWLLN